MKKFELGGHNCNWISAELAVILITIGVPMESYQQFNDPSGLPFGCIFCLVLSIVCFFGWFFRRPEKEDKKEK